MLMSFSREDGLMARKPERQITSEGSGPAVGSASAGRLRSKLYSLHLLVCFTVSKWVRFLHLCLWSITLVLNDGSLTHEMSSAGLSTRDSITKPSTSHSRSRPPFAAPNMYCSSRRKHPSTKLHSLNSGRRPSEPDLACSAMHNVVEHDIV